MMGSYDKVLSVEITDQEVHMLWYTKEFPKDLTSVIFETIPLTPGIIEQGMVKKPSELSQILENSRRSQGANSKVQAQITISVINGFIREYHLPWVSKRDQHNLIKYLADEEIPIPPEESAYDAWIEEKASERLRAVLCGIRKDIITAVVMCFEAAGFDISSIGFSSLAWANALALEAGTNTLYIKKLTDQYQFIFYHGDLPKSTRILFIEDNKEQLIPFYNEDIIKILDYYFSPFQDSGPIQRILLSSEIERAQLEQLVCNYLKGRQEIEPQLQKVTEVISLSYGLKLEDDKYLAVVGRALQTSNSKNDFLRDKAKRKNKSQKQLSAVVLFSFLSLIGLGVSYHLQDRVEEINEEIYELHLNRERLSKAELLEASRMQELLALNEDRSGVGEDIRLLQSLSGKGVEFDRIKYQADQVTIDGKALQATLVQKLLKDLQAIGYTEPHLQNYYGQEDEEKRYLKFTISAQRNHPKI